MTTQTNQPPYNVSMTNKPIVIIESMMPVTILLVKIERMVSRDEKRDWISPKCLFLEKDNGKLAK